MVAIGVLAFCLIDSITDFRCECTHRLATAKYRGFMKDKLQLVVLAEVIDKWCQFGAESVLIIEEFYDSN